MSHNKIYESKVLVEKVHKELIKKNVGGHSGSAPDDLLFLSDGRLPIKAEPVHCCLWICTPALSKFTSSYLGIITIKYMCECVCIDRLMILRFLC